MSCIKIYHLRQMLAGRHKCFKCGERLTGPEPRCPASGSGLGFVNLFGTDNPKPCYLNECAHCGKWFLAVSKHLPTCRPCGGNPDVIYANTPQDTAHKAMFYIGPNVQAE